jgi:hypothetical protein
MFTADIKVAATNCKWFKTLLYKIRHFIQEILVLIVYHSRKACIWQLKSLRHVILLHFIINISIILLSFLTLFALFFLKGCYDALSSNCYLLVCVLPKCKKFWLSEHQIHQI